MSTKQADAVRLPLAFYDDHESRGLPTPAAVRRTTRNVWVDRTDSALPELVSDAKFYADPYGPDTPGLKAAARALLRSLEGVDLQPLQFTDEQLAQVRCPEPHDGSPGLWAHPGNHLAECGTCHTIYVAEQVLGRRPGLVSW